MTKEAFKIYVVRYIHEAVIKGKPKRQTMEGIRDIVESISSLNMREKSDMYKLLKIITDSMYENEGKLENDEIKFLSVNVNKIMERRNSRVRTKNLAKEMQDSRAKNGVFYLCSIHSNPAEDHKDWQGKIYVDRYWKSILKEDVAARKKVAAYVKNKDILTVQQICGAPVYMITRPYCMHYFIELDTEEVLNNGIKAVRKNHPEAHSKEHHVDYRVKYYNTRKRIHKAMGMNDEAAYDRGLVSRAKKREKENQK